jgi:hypothetical protein
MGLLVCLKGPLVGRDGVMFVGGLVVDHRALLGHEAGELEDPFLTTSLFTFSSCTQTSKPIEPKFLAE